MAPSWIAAAISRILSVPVSASSTDRTRNAPTASARSAVAAEKYNQNHSPPPRVNSW